MKVLIISDIYGNFPALKKCLKKEHDFDLLISLGDVVNFGSWCNECVQMIESYENKLTIIGNQEQNF